MRTAMEGLSPDAAVMANSSTVLKTLRRAPPKPSMAVSTYSRTNHSMRAAAAQKVLQGPLLGWNLPP